MLGLISIAAASVFGGSLLLGAPSADNLVSVDSESGVRPQVYYSARSTVVDSQPISFDTRVVEDDGLPAGTEIIVNEGSVGVRKTIESLNEDNVAVVSTVVERQPVDKVVVRGTSEIISGVDSKVVTAEMEKAAEEAAAAEAAAEEAATVSDSSSSGSNSSSVNVTYSSPTSAEYSLSQFMFNGVVNWDNKKFTYYSASVLPGGGLSIPGRHINEGGYVADIDGYIVLAAPYGVAHGTTYSTPFGYTGKVYDTCASCTTSPLWLDVYVR